MLSVAPPTPLGPQTVLGGDGTDLRPFTHEKQKCTEAQLRWSEGQSPGRTHINCDPAPSPTGSLMLAFQSPLTDCGTKVILGGAAALCGMPARARPLPRWGPLPPLCTGRCRADSDQGAPLGQGPQVSSPQSAGLRTHGFWTNLSARSLPWAPIGPWAAPGRAPQCNGGWAGGQRLTQEVQGHHMTTDGRHLEADQLASEGPGVLVH